MSDFRPGKRLKQFRLDAGIKTAKAMVALASTKGYPLRYKQYCQLERSERNPDYYEINAICTILGITADHWLRGVVNISGQLNSKLHYLTDRQLDIVLELAELVTRNER